MKFIAHGKYGVDRRAITNALSVHTDYAERLRTDGKLAIAGPYLDQHGEIIGVHLVYEVESEAEAVRLVHDDPFSLQGIFGSCEVKEWRVLGSNLKLLRDLERRLERGGDAGADGNTKTFLNYTRYTDDAAKLAKVRPSHREYARALWAQGKIAMAGPLVDDTGAMFVYEAASRKEALDLVKEDPYAVEGVFTDCELSEWRVRGLNIGLFSEPVQ